MKFYFVISVIFLSMFLADSDLLRSKYLTQDMIDNVENLDKYERKAIRIFNEYEKAKFYQIVAYTYYDNYKNLVEELESLDRHYYYAFSNYNAEQIFNNIDSIIKTPGVQNKFSPILFDDKADINIKLFKAKAKMFKKQYYDYLDYFNEKVGLYTRKLLKVKKEALSNKSLITYDKIYKDYYNFLLDIESIDRDIKDELAVRLDEDGLISKIIWSGQKYYEREFHYFENSDQISKTVDFKNGKITFETNYNFDISKNNFIQFVSVNDMLDNELEEYGNYSIAEYNDFEKAFKITYYSINNSIIGIITREFEEDFFKLINENWYIGDYNKKVREFNQIFEPKTGKYIWTEKINK